MSDTTYAVLSLSPLDPALLPELRTLCESLGGRAPMPFQDVSTGHTGAVLVVLDKHKKQLQENQLIKRSGGSLVLCNTVEAGKKLLPFRGLGVFVVKACVHGCNRFE
eukprot:Gregarina_sp_Poly_1__5414@NODE_285_length_10045_cov_61_806174_g246_i0_p12_GENE_NODE_285_length_10045_cov_61_806174_g246_i0NODE_285_length_10045_cov_61_806174_g246_i0_p12_ORF_typecomplete_len107_score11_34_NODE_285_length_10045_cov_61_806174_g246_i029523272